MKRILQVCNTDFYLSKFLLPLVRKLVEEGYDVECVCTGKSYHHEFKELGVKIHYFEFPQKASPLKFLHAIYKFRNFLRENKFDCVNSHNRNASIVARVAAWIAQVPINLYTAHGFYFHDAQSKWAFKLTEWLEALLSYTSTYILSQSRKDVDYVIQQGWYHPNKIQVIDNGIDTNRFSPKKTKEDACKNLGLSNVFRVAATGRMVRGKGFKDLIRAFARFQKNKNVELLFVGGNISQDIDPALSEFRQLIYDLSIEDKVIITGLVDNVEDYLSASDMFVLPSYREGVPRALIEAMSMQLISVATNIRGCNEIIEHNTTGFLYEPHDVDQLTEHLENIYQMREERLLFGRRARQRVIQVYDEKKYIQTQLYVFNKLMGDSESQSWPKVMND
jgi:glycosyltransferase involved in cell wall biosynthesis